MLKKNNRKKRNPMVIQRNPMATQRNAMATQRNAMVLKFQRQSNDANIV